MQSDTQDLPLDIQLVTNTTNNWSNWNMINAAKRNIKEETWHSSSTINVWSLMNFINISED